MKKRFVLFIIFIMLIINIITLFLILKYVDPYFNKTIWVSSLIVTFILSVSTFFTFILYIFKKIYYRWEVFIYHVLTSFRQSFLFSVFIVWLMFFYIENIPMILTSFLLLIMLFFIEFLFQNIKN